MDRWAFSLSPSWGASHTNHANFFFFFFFTILSFLNPFPFLLPFFCLVADSQAWCFLFLAQSLNRPSYRASHSFYSLSPLTNCCC